MKAIIPPGYIVPNDCKTDKNQIPVSLYDETMP